MLKVFHRKRVNFPPIFFNFFRAHIYTTQGLVSSQIDVDEESQTYYSLQDSL